MVRILEVINYMKEYAENNNVPIMQSESLEYIKRKIKNMNATTILEIGTAIGYSGINFVSVSDDIYLTTIERDESRYNEAIKNVKNAGLESRINVIYSDALEIEIKNLYDVIVIDAAKGKNIDFFNRFKNNLKENGVIIVDNIKFHGLVGNSSSIKSKNLRRLVEKIEESIEYLKVQEDYYTEFVDLGDGLAIVSKNNNQNH